MSDNTETDKKSVAARLVSMAQERYLLGLSEEGEPFVWRQDDLFAVTRPDFDRTR